MMIALALLASFALNAQADQPSVSAKGARHTGSPQRVMPSASDSHVAGIPAGTFWYNGDFNGVNGLGNEMDTSLGTGQYAHVYDDFNVPDTDGWDVKFVFSNNLENTNVIGATWEIRQGISEGNGGTLIDSGTTTTPYVARTGRSGFGFIEYLIGVDVTTHLAGGGMTYFLNVTPQGDLTGRSFVSNTSGANCVGTPCGNNQNAFFDSNFFGAVFSSTANFGQPSDFSMGVANNPPPPTPTPTPTPPPPAAWYNGDFNGLNGLPNEDNFAGSGQYGHTYDDFNVTGDGWTIDRAYSNNLLEDSVLGAYVEIRQGVSVGNGGTLIYSGVDSAATVTATGRSGFGFFEYQVEAVVSPAQNLAVGKYWLLVSPIGTGGGLSYVSTTSGAHCVGTPCGNDDDSFFDSNIFGAFFAAASDLVGFPADFSMGVFGPTPTPTIPPPTPTPTPGTIALWYNGDFNGVNGLSNEMDTSLGSGQYAHVYDDFNVPDTSGWDVNLVFSNNLENTNVVGATWEIRQRISEGNGGILIASGATTTPHVTPTGRSGFGFIEYQIGVDVNTHLPMGTYFLNVTPQGDLTGRSFVSNTSGANCVGTPCGNNQHAFFDSNFFGFVFTSTANLGQPADFSMGVSGGDLAGGLTLTGAASVAGGFGIPIGVNGDCSGVECRNSVRQTVMFTFNNPITDPGTVSISPCGTVGAVTVSGNTVSVKVNVAGCNQTQETVTLSGANGEGDFSACYGVNFGDVNGDGVVNNADIFGVRANLGQNTNGSNFRSDVNADGRINQKDVGVVKNNRGH